MPVDTSPDSPRSADRASSPTPAARRLRGALFDMYLAATNVLLALPGHWLRRSVMTHVGRVQMGPACSVERRVRLTTKAGVALGTGCIIGRGTILDGRGGLHLGDHVAVSPEALLLSSAHQVDSPDFLGDLRLTTIGSRSWIASRAIVLPGSRVGEGAVVAAGAVVHGDVLPRTIVAGSPAMPIRARSPAAQQRLTTYRRWWH